MVAYNDAWLYLAFDVQDDKTFVGSAVEQASAGGADGCWSYRTGLQIGFEIGGQMAPVPGLVQAERSEDLAVSRMLHVGLGLRPGQETCASARMADTLGLDNRTTCCVNGREAATLTRTQVAILRNPNNRRTAIEVAVAMRDLLPEAALRARYESDAAGAMQWEKWRKGLRVGFSFALNDGDDRLASEGWVGYYPHAIKTGDGVPGRQEAAPGETPGAFNKGQREPSKCGVLELGGEFHGASGGAAAAGGFDGGLFALGLLIGCFASGFWSLLGSLMCQAASAASQRAVDAVGAAALFVLGWWIGAGGGLGSLAWGVLTGGLVVLVGYLGWRAMQLNQSGDPITLAGLFGAAAAGAAGPPSRSRTDPLAAADQSSFTPPMVTPVGAPPLPTGSTV